MNRFLAFAFLLFVVASLGWADPERRWPAWRGPDAAGSSWKGSYPPKLSGGENLLWKVSLPGKGCSTPVVWNDHVLLTCPVEGEDAAGGDPGPFTALGIFLGIKAAVKHKLGKDSVEGVHVAVQGTGSVGGGVARLLAKDGAKLTLSDIHEDRAAALAARDASMGVACDVFSPNALGAILDEDGSARLDTPIVAGGANNQLKRAEHGPLLAERGILYAPDYVINAGGIISVTLEYLCRRDRAPCDINEVRKRIALIPGRLEQIWQESDASGASPDQVADRMAQELIGR